VSRSITLAEPVGRDARRLVLINFGIQRDIAAEL